ncbi:DUF6096 family protein [Streptococcus acidominimus]|uniref:Prophage protein n=1 Tax=Streptococcus acidominimus TaxID=1326 RepID=A0A1Q8EFW8_STRAI|nr:DUF6096 family protein [Streptococcus acidominimus]OLF50659.1 hypothetical protein BU200_01165 [Streptococcus acidominimus]QBX13681.1 hypothetical protein Javan1_0041 [Streptococcus phage Javan1]SUN05050.1 prophage protein [Streptococcus acidominimus]
MSVRKPYTTWTVKNEEYKLRLSTRQVCEVEEKLGVNLLKIFMPKPGEQFNLPPLKVMLVIIHGALQKFHHGTKLDDVYDLFDDYIDDGYGQTELMTDVIMPLFEVSGFIPKDKETKEPTLTVVD